MNKRPPPPYLSEPQLEGSDGRIRTIYHPSITRRPRKERYIYQSEDVSKKFLLSIVHMIDVVLNDRGNLTLQDVADMIDYGPNQLSPRQHKTIAMLSESFERSVNEQLKQCAKGKHMMQNGRCWMCKESALRIVSDDDEKVNK